MKRKRQYFSCQVVFLTVILLGLLVSSCGKKSPKVEEKTTVPPPVASGEKAAPKEEKEPAATVPKVSGSELEKTAAAKRTDKLGEVEVPAPAPAPVAAEVSPEYDVHAKSALPPPQRTAPALQAGISDDNEVFGYYMQFLKDNLQASHLRDLHLENRSLIYLKDQAGRSLPNVRVTITASGAGITQTLTTHADGSVIFQPGLWGWERKPMSLTIEGNVGAKRFSEKFSAEQRDILEIKVPIQRSITNPVPLDIAFLLDTTGSMADEIQRLKDTLYAINFQLANAKPKPAIRWAMILYWDRQDSYITQKHDFTSDVSDFLAKLAPVTADGGGDGPEDLQSALEEALTNLHWRDDSIRLTFVVTDAPPHTDYGQEHDYIWAMQQGAERGIKFFSVACSGFNVRYGELIMRQLAQVTGGSFVFLTYGERGESEGAATAEDVGRVSHHTGANYAVSTLDEAIIKLVKRELSFLQDEEMSVPDLASGPEQGRLKERVEVVVEQVGAQFDALGTGGWKSRNFIVANFESDRPELTSLSDFLSQTVLTVLVKRNLKVVDRDHLDKILQEQGKQITDLYDQEQAVEVGKLVGAHYMIVGKVIEIGAVRYLNLKVLDIESSLVVAASQVTL